MVVFGINTPGSSLGIHARGVIKGGLAQEIDASVEWWPMAGPLPARGPWRTSDVWVALWWRTLAVAPDPVVKIICVYDHESYQCDEFVSLLRRADVLVAGSLGLLQGLREWLAASGGPRLPPCFIVQPGVDLSRFPLADLPTEFVALWAGNSWAMDDDGKGLEIAREACRQADIPLRIADRTGDEGQRLDNKEMVGFYASGSVLLVPSRNEGAPRCALEAMACGRPVVGTRVGLLPELVAHGLTGCIVPRDAASFSLALAYMHDLQQRHGATIADLCRHSASRYSIHRCVRSWALAIIGAITYAKVRNA